MKMLALLLTLLMGACSCASVPDYAKVKPATVRLEMNPGVCSGTAIGSHAILTARHCLSKDIGEVTVSGVLAAYIVLADDGNDHIIIRVTARQKQFARIGAKPKQGDPVFMHGNPSAFPDLLRVGYVSGWYMGQMLVDANNFYGDSGAAVFDSKGEIVGTVNSMFPWPNQGWRLTMVNAFKFTPEQWELARS